VTSRGPKAIALAYTARAGSVDVGWVNMHAYNVFVSGPKLTKFLSPTWEELWLITAFPIFDISISPRDIHDQSLTLPEIATNLHVFALTFFGLRVPPPKLYPNFYPCFAARHVAKFGEGNGIRERREGKGERREGRIYMIKAGLTLPQSAH